MNSILSYALDMIRQSELTRNQYLPDQSCFGISRLVGDCRCSEKNVYHICEALKNMPVGLHVGGINGGRMLVAGCR